MARYIFMHLGQKPVVTPDFATLPEVEAWAQATYGYGTDEKWKDITDWRDNDYPPLPTSTGDVDFDWPVKRTLCDEDWYVGPIEVLESVEKAANVSLTIRELDLLLEDLGARAHEMLDHLDELNDEEEEFAALESRLQVIRAKLEQDDE